MSPLAGKFRMHKVFVCRTPYNLAELEVPSGHLLLNVITV